MRIGIAADHKGFLLKQEIFSQLKQDGLIIKDYGAFSLNPEDDFPDFVAPMAKDVSQKVIDRGVAICGSGIGACIAANKVKNARASVIQDMFSARQGVEDDHMNIICLNAHEVDFSLALELIHRFLNSHFKADERFLRRLEKIHQLEELELRS